MVNDSHPPWFVFHWFNDMYAYIPMLNDSHLMMHGICARVKQTGNIDTSSLKSKEKYLKKKLKKINRYL